VGQEGFQDGRGFCSCGGGVLCVCVGGGGGATEQGLVDVTTKKNP